MAHHYIWTDTIPLSAAGHRCVPGFIANAILLDHQCPAALRGMIGAKQKGATNVTPRVSLLF